MTAMSHARPERTPVDMAAAALAGDRRAAARLISLVEAADPAAGPAMSLLFRRGRDTRIVGITGPPGAGKSTLVDQLIALRRLAGERVAVLAVDPASPRSGGSLLGDRVRMTRHNTDADVFIRSLSTRGHLGGLTAATGDALIVLDALGFDCIIVETVGAGQNEFDIMDHADTVVVVQTPVAGDEVQAMKSGLLEIADLIAVNKCDAPGAERTVSWLREAAEARGGRPSPGWTVPLIKTQAVAGTGVVELNAALDAHRRQLGSQPDASRARRRDRARILLLRRMTDMLRARHARPAQHANEFERALDDILARRRDPGSAAADLLRGAT
jgi:LAO/AO transport system kinase